MNLTDPEHSMMYNCLTDIIVLWKNGDQANAELLAKATCNDERRIGEQISARSDFSQERMEKTIVI